VQPKLPVKSDMEQPVAERLELLRRLVPPQNVEQLAEVVRRFIESKAEVDLHRWSKAVDYTSSRVGFSHVQRSGKWQLTRSSRSVGGGIRGSQGQGQRSDSVVRVDEYFALRAHLGLAIA